MNGAKGQGRVNPTRTTDHLSGPRRSVSKPVLAHGQAALYLADCFDWLEARAANSIEAVITDPPYGLVEYSEVQQRKLREGRGGVWRCLKRSDVQIYPVPVKLLNVLTVQDRGRQVAPCRLRLSAEQLAMA